MKKAIVLLLALTVIGGAVFAQDAELKFSGYIDTGIAVDVVGSDDPTVSLYGDDSGTASRFNLVANYTNGNVGAYARLRVQGDFDQSRPEIFLNRGYVWFNFFDGLATTKVGRLDDYSWSTASNDFGNFDTLTGLQLLVKPIEGLSFGFMVPVKASTVTEGAVTSYFDGAAIAYAGYDEDDDTHVVITREASVTTKQTLEDALKDINIGAAYDIEGLGGFRAGINLDPADDSTQAYFGAKITAVENFEFWGEYLGANFGSDDAGSHYFWWEVDYKMDALGAGIDLEQALFANEDLPVYLSFGPYASYTIDSFVVGGQVTYFMTTSSDVVIFDSINGVEFGPYVTYQPSDNATLKLGACIGTGDLSWYDTDEGFSTLSDTTTKVFLSYTLSF